MKYKPEHNPTPTEIRLSCEEIQATWTDRERVRRAGRIIAPDVSHELPTWQPPVYPAAGIPEER